MKKQAASVLLFCSVFGLVACGGNQAEPATPGTAPAASAPAKEDHHAKKGGGGGVVKAPGEANIGDTTTCPVSGEEFEVTASSPKVEHDGKTYFMCCPGCKKKFEANPNAFLHKS